MSSKKIEQEPMVKWLEPRQLGRTGFEVIISTLFGKHADRRLLQPSITSHSANFYLYKDGKFQTKSIDAAIAEMNDPNIKKETETPEEFWINYIADVGDGFDSTYTTAHYLAKPELNFNADFKLDENGEIKTEFGKLLIFGGDEVYPTASPETYQTRLVNLYEKVFPKKNSDNLPAVFAIPGNHDWYDSLVEFSRRFCEQIRFAGWQTMQERSYFAIKLVQGWWLFGTDLQLETSLDKPQSDYFKKVMKLVGDDDRIILCNAVPYWSEAKLKPSDIRKTANEKVEDFEKEFSPFRRMEFFEGRILDEKTAVFLAGDLHHYCHHKTIISKKKQIKHKIIAGGGGAFMHPTHTENVEFIGTKTGNQFKKETCFPDMETSPKVFNENFLSIRQNWFYGIVPAVVCLLMALAFQSDIGKFGLSQIRQALQAVFTDFLTKPFALFLTAIVIISFIASADGKGFRRVALGVCHAIAELAGIFFVIWGAAYFVSGGSGINYGSIWQILFTAALIFIGGWIVGSLIMILYLVISIKFFKTHSNMAYAALGIKDYKNFLRIKISPDGSLTIYPIGIRRVPTWKLENGNFATSDNSADFKPFLIEKPIVVIKE